MTEPGDAREKPLAGRRLVVTRAGAQGGGLRAALEALGATALALPTIEIAKLDSSEHLDAALRAIESYQWMVLTSANAAAVLGERLHAIGLSTSAFGHLRFAAVGKATAAALEALGFAVAVVPERYVAESLAEALLEQTRGQRVLLLRPRVARDVVPDALRSAGAEVECVDAYATIVPAGGAEELATVLRVEPAPDAVLFASSSAVRNFFALLEQAGARVPGGLHAVSIGPITSATLRELGWTPSAEAEVSTVEGLVQACVRLFAHSGQ